MEPWVEALDVDDSDLHPPPPLLRRCTVQSTSTAAYISQSQTLVSTPSQSQSETLDSAPAQSRTIPGPAGIVQAAKLRKALDDLNREGEMATQEYIRKLVEDPAEDEDFKHNPWLSAIEFVYGDDMVGSAAVATAPLGEINKYQKDGKLDQVVAVIKSCTPNGLGDMTVALKDPTGAVSGTIHHKVLTEGDFRKGICVGSVLILKEVSVFSPSRSTHYLNITKRNLVKVFYKDGGSSQILTFHATIDAPSPSGGKFPFSTSNNNSTHLSSQNSERGTPTLGSTFSLEGGAEGMMNRMTRSDKNNEQEHINYSQTSNNGTNMQIARDKETLKEVNVIGTGGTFPYSTSNKSIHLLSQESLRGTATLSSAFSFERGAEGITNRMKRSKVNNEQENINYNTTGNTRDEVTLKEADVIDKGKNVGQLSEGCTNGLNEIKALLPGWTEDQVLELCFE